ncbi:MAG TPA: hypothetical protein VH142_21870 [Polyangiaceae bacterium]|jgi:hypothetical protein|nr:hypothetical protein [Polyangiaceae bacterium]
MPTFSIPVGEDVLAFFARLDAPADEWVNAVGIVEGVKLAVARPDGSDENVELAGRTTLLNLCGPRSGPLMAVFAGRVNDAAGVSGGRLLGARSAGVFASINNGAGASEVPVVAPPVSAAAHPDDDETEEMPRFGDRLEHFVFGLCDVMVVKGERIKIRDVAPPHRLREIHIGAMKLLAPTERDGHRTFKLVKRN